MKIEAATLGTQSNRALGALWCRNRHLQLAKQAWLWAGTRALERADQKLTGDD
jgi:hypothetical protein